MSTVDDPSSLPLEAYYDLTQLGEVAISPDGDRIAFTATEYDEDEERALTSLFVVPTDGSREPHRLTRRPSASSPAWGPDGERLAFLAAREEDVARRVGWSGSGDDGGGDSADEDGGDKDETEDASSGDEEPKKQVWVYDLAWGGDPLQVTDFEEGANEFDWSPGGDRLVVAARDPTDEQAEYLERVRDGGPIETTRLQHKLDGVGWTDDIPTYLFVVDLDADEADRLDDAYGGGAFQDLNGLTPDWGPDDRIAFTSCRRERPDDTMARDVYTISPDGSNLERLTDGTRTCGEPTWHADGTLSFFSEVPDEWARPTELVYYDGSEVRSLTDHLDRTVARAASIEPAGESAYTLLADESRTRLVRVSRDGSVEWLLEGRDDGPGSDGASTNDDRELSDHGRPVVGNRSLAGIDLDHGAETAAVAISDPTTGTDVYSLDLGGVDDCLDSSSLTRCTRLNETLSTSYSMPEVRSVTWESDGWTIDGVCYHDPDVDPESGDHPLVVAIHGGPLSYDEPVFAFSHAALTSRGYVIFRPNYRGGSSRGHEFASHLAGRWGTTEVTDVVAGVESLADRGWIDPERVFGYGFSYGGITQGFLVTQTDVLTAAAPEHGIYDLRSAFGTDDTHNWLEADYGLPWEETGSYDASSAILDAGNIDTPLLVMAGGNDWRCPPSQSEQLYLAARKQDVDAKLVVYPDEHHNVGDPDRAIHRLEEIISWYEKHDPAT